MKKSTRVKIEALIASSNDEYESVLDYCIKNKLCTVCGSPVKPGSRSMYKDHSYRRCTECVDRSRKYKKKTNKKKSYNHSQHCRTYRESLPDKSLDILKSKVKDNYKRTYGKMIIYNKDIVENFKVGSLFPLKRSLQKFGLEKQLKIVSIDYENSSTVKIQCEHNKHFIGFTLSNSNAFTITEMH